MGIYLIRALGSPKKPGNGGMVLEGVSKKFRAYPRGAKSSLDRG